MSNNHAFIMFMRILKAGAQNFIRNATLAIAAIAVMVITLTIVLFSVVANATFSNTVKQITDKIDISVYLKDEVTDDQRKVLTEGINKTGNVKSVEYVSKDQALELYKKQNASNTDLLLAISQTDNPLPSSLKIKPRDPNRIEDIRAFLDKPENKTLQSEETDTQEDRKEAIEKITQATSFFQKAGLAGVIIFALVSMLIIFNTIQMAIFNRRDELTIMRLLGASTSYIRGPFIVETVLYGIVAGVISVTLVESLFTISESAFGASSLGILDIKFANDYFADRFWIILGAQLGMGIFIGAASSLIATRRYLKFKTSR